MTGVDWLDRVAEIVQYAHESREGPALATEGFPDFSVMFKRSKGDQRIVR